MPGSDSYIKQRHSPRKRENRDAWIDAENGSSLIDCTVFDVSDDGVRISVDEPRSVPQEFFLVLTKDGKLRRRCKVVWRSSEQIGACYLTAPIYA